LTDISLLRQHKHLAKRQDQLVLRAGLALSSRGRGREDRVIASASDLCDFADERMHQAMELFDMTSANGENRDAITADHVQVERNLMMRYCSALAMVTQVARARLINDEDVPLSDRLFSVYESHTECIHRGKARATVEFGHRCLIVEDSAGFIVHSHVMANGRQDRDVTATVTRLLKRQFPELIGISFDRGFHSPQNQQRLAEILPESCLPTPGVHAAAAQYQTASIQWKELRRNHPGVEAAIGNLQLNHGCDTCPNKGRKGYERHLATAVISANLINLGRIIIAKKYPDSNAAQSYRQPPPRAA
jgi:IS5 family transposase